jgi:arginase family enzyme
VAAKYPGLAGAYADAHLDVRDTPGSGMPFRSLIEECNVGPLTVHGMVNLANSAEHVDWFLAHGGTIAPAGDTIAVGAGARELFVSVDLDVIDAAHAPGVSAMNPCGWDVNRAESFVRGAARHPGLRCFDLMELCPTFDHAGRTARVAAFLFLTFLRGFAGRT